MNEQAYLEFERQSDTKHDFVDGEVFAMAGASRRHNLICAYTSATLIDLLGDEPCEVYPSDMRLKVEATGLMTYPDLSVVCGEPRFLDDKQDTLLNPIVIIEVLSPSTERFDRGRKLQDYRRIPSLREYLLISQDQPCIERFMRQDGGNWLYSDVIGLENKIELPSIACVLVLSAVYRKVHFEGNSVED